MPKFLTSAFYTYAGEQMSAAYSVATRLYGDKPISYDQRRDLANKLDSVLSHPMDVDGGPKPNRKRRNSIDSDIRKALRLLNEETTAENAERLSALLRRVGLNETPEQTARREREEAQRERDHARGVIQRDYWADVEGIVDEIKSEIASGDISSESQLQDRVHEAVDGSQRVIYTLQAQEGLVVSQNDGAYFDDNGSAEGAVSDSGINWEVLMFHALRADVMEELGDFDALVEELAAPETCEVCGETYPASQEHICE